MSSFRVLSTTVIHAPNHNLCDSTGHTIELTPWDLQFLPYKVNQKGLIYHHPFELDTSNQIQHLKNSLSSTLEFFPPFTGRLKITEHKNKTISCSVSCDNEGALFVHAIAENTCVADILGSTYVPQIVHSFFPLNGVKNYEGISQPLLAVQVTELVDGVFIGCTINHVVVDGKSFWLFINTWAKISNGCQKISKCRPTFKRWFPNDIECPIRFPFTKEPQNSNPSKEEMLNPPRKIFHFTKENITKLKFRANSEVGTTNISSLQSLFTHVWRSIVNSKKIDPKEEVNYMISIGIRPRLIPPLQEDYFGNAMIDCVVTMNVGDLLGDGGLGKGALEMNKMIALHSDEKLKSHYGNWLKTPSFVNVDEANSKLLVISGSPWFNVYGNNFGWGEPVGVRNGGENIRKGNICVFAGVEEGSMDLEVCLSHKNLEAIENNPEFMDYVSS